MEALLALAGSRRRCSCHDGSNHAAIFFCNGRILSYGENRPRTRPPFPTVHAECDAMRKLPPTGRRRKHLDLLVIRLNKGGSVGNSKPCGMCLKELQKLPGRGYILDTVHYSNLNRIVSVKFSELISAPKHITKFFSDDPNDRRTQQKSLHDKEVASSRTRIYG